ncbi:MAG TPA: glutathione synthase [Sphingomicrobium sp.]|nr:glutathione synthase [Sphingomicrobium sp.]
MSLRVAVQMDPLEEINISGDSTFSLMLKAQDRGHSLYHYLAGDLTYQDGRLYAGAHKVSVKNQAGDHFVHGDFAILDLGKDVDVVLMRQDPPFDLGYITATHLLERIQDETVVVNDPAAVRNAPEKVWVLDFARFMPPTMLTRSVGAARRFLEEHGDIVIKPLHGNAGKAVFKIGSDGSNLAPLMELFNATYREPHVLQAFLPEVSEGDKRIVLVDGEIAGAINRRPAKGDIRSNLAAGGTAEATDLTAPEREICDALGPELKKRGLLFVGIDVIGGRWLTEINVTSPTGIVAIDKFNGSDTASLIWDAIEARVAARHKV